ncbi:MAG: sigma-70 family RNA polymerase sigma factor [Gemmatimonadota bacterium]
MSRPADSSKDQITRLLVEARDGDRAAFDRLLPAVYEELRSLAQGRLRWERDGHTLNATALVHEAYLKLVDQDQVQWQSRGHFFAVASEAMRRILVNHARARNAQKRGGAHDHVDLHDTQVFSSDREAEGIEALGDALDRLQAFDPRGAHVVTYRFFGGLSHGEVAEVLGVSEITVRRAWTSARVWLRRELGDDFGLEASP